MMWYLNPLQSPQVHKSMRITLPVRLISDSFLLRMTLSPTLIVNVVFVGVFDAIVSVIKIIEYCLTLSQCKITLQDDF